MSGADALGDVGGGRVLDRGGLQEGLDKAGAPAVRPGCRVQGLGFRVQGAGFRVRGAGFKVQGSGCRVHASCFRVQGSGFRVQGSGFMVQGSGFRSLRPRAGGFRRRNQIQFCGLSPLKRPSFWACPFQSRMMLRSETFPSL